MKYNKEEIWQVRKEMFRATAWLKARIKAKEKKCTECKHVFEGNEYIALMTLHGKANVHLCNSCADKYIELGAIDILKQINNAKNKKEDLLGELKSFKKYMSTYEFNRLEKKSTEELEDFLATCKEIKAKKDVIDLIDSSKWKIEGYLVDQYNVIMDKRSLKSTEQIEDYFKDVAMDYMECGQGYFEDEHAFIVMIDNKYYQVDVVAEIGSARQDRGDRLYWIDEIKSVTYKEIDKPLKKQTSTETFTVKDITYEQHEYIKKMLKEAGIEIEA